MGREDRAGAAPGAGAHARAARHKTARIASGRLWRGTVCTATWASRIRRPANDGIRRTSLVDIVWRSGRNAVPQSAPTATGKPPEDAWSGRVRPLILQSPREHTAAS